jgi:UDP-GlcNAc:undecaprenyl-phosphate GlcNAc-1-phosphate transferase
VREYVLTLLVAASVTYVLTPVARRLAMRLGAVAAIRDRDVHVLPTPRMGGLAMFAGLLAALLVASNLPLLQSVFDDSSDPQALLSGAFVVVLLGAADDRWQLDALTKLAGQVLAAGVMVLQGIQLLWLPLPDRGAFVLPPSLGVPLTVLVVVVTINAVNFVDGLDGLAAGIVAIAAGAFFVFSYLLWVQEGVERAATPTLITAVLVGMCAGFLPHNFHPARIFMGDSGSMLIGLMLAASTITLTGQLAPSVFSGIERFVVPALLPLVLPLLVLLVPMADLLLAVVRRTRAGRSPFAADKQHLHHRLLEIGHSHRRAVVVMYAWSALIAFGRARGGDGSQPVVAARGRHGAHRLARCDAQRRPAPVGPARGPHARRGWRVRSPARPAVRSRGVSPAAEGERPRACLPTAQPPAAHRRPRGSPRRASGSTTRASDDRPGRCTPGSRGRTPPSVVSRSVDLSWPASRTCPGPTRCPSPAATLTRWPPSVVGVRPRRGAAGRGGRGSAARRDRDQPDFHPRQGL